MTNNMKTGLEPIFLSSRFDKSIIIILFCVIHWKEFSMIREGITVELPRLVVEEVLTGFT